MTEAEIADICNQLAEGKSLRAICREMDRDESAVRYHLDKPENFPQYARAREFQADAFFDAVVGIADGTDPDAAETVDARRLQIDARKWAAGKLKGKYSDKVKHVGGDDGDNPIAFTGFDVRFIEEVDPAA
jgi:hypothetical protein